MYAKMSKKGQVTIPKAVRKKLNIETDGSVLFLIEKEEIILKGIPASEAEQLAGSLSKYADGFVSLKEIRKKIRGEIAGETAKEGLTE